jgi:hypothetical protein
LPPSQSRRRVRDAQNSAQHRTRSAKANNHDLAGGIYSPTTSYMKREKPTVATNSECKHSKQSVSGRNATWLLVSFPAHGAYSCATQTNDLVLPHSARGRIHEQTNLQ